MYPRSSAPTISSEGLVPCRTLPSPITPAKFRGPEGPTLIDSCKERPKYQAKATSPSASGIASGDMNDDGRASRNSAARLSVTAEIARAPCPSQLGSLHSRNRSTNSARVEDCVELAAV